AAQGTRSSELSLLLVMFVVAAEDCCSRVSARMLRAAQSNRNQRYPTAISRAFLGCRLAGARVGGAPTFPRPSEQLALQPNCVARGVRLAAITSWWQPAVWGDSG